MLNNKIEHLGNKGTFIKVSSGYARNYLIPTNQASIITNAKVKQIENLTKKHIQKEKEKESQYLILKLTLEKINKFIIRKISNVNGQIFGSVSEKDLCNVIFNYIASNIENNHILLPEIKFTGNYFAQIQFTNIIKVNIELQILPDIRN